MSLAHDEQNCLIVSDLCSTKDMWEPTATVGKFMYTYENYCWYVVTNSISIPGPLTILKIFNAPGMEIP